MLSVNIKTRDGERIMEADEVNFYRAMGNEVQGRNAHVIISNRTETNPMLREQVIEDAQIYVMSAAGKTIAKYDVRRAPVGVELTD